MKKSIFYLSIFFTSLILITTSCSKKLFEANEAIIEPTVYSGGVYIDCYAGPYFYNIDSLIKNCSVAKSLDDVYQPIDSFKGPFGSCTYDSEAHKLADINNFDFKTARQGSKIEFSNTPISQKLVEAKTISEGGNFPYIQFYSGYEIQIAENQVLTLLFFNAQIAACFHNVMIWELMES